MWNLGSWNIFSCFSDSSVHCSSSTLKQKIMMEVQFGCEKRKTEALTIAAGFGGVISVEVGEDQVTVVGVGVDSVCLARSLRKKLDYAVIVGVEEVKKKEEEKKPVETIIPIQWTTPTYVHYQYPVCC